MYPWSESDQELAPPRTAPSINVLPKEIRDLFEKEFKEKEREVQSYQDGELSRWFEVLDRILRNLICCITDPDHWYLPGLVGCPWCQQTGIKKVRTIRAVTRYLPAPRGIVRLLSSPRIAGYLMMPGRYRRREVATRQIPSQWGVIPLPSERAHRLLLSPLLVIFLPLKENRPILLIPRRRFWISCIQTWKSL